MTEEEKESKFSSLHKKKNMSFKDGYCVIVWKKNYLLLVVQLPIQFNQYQEIRKVKHFVLMKKYILNIYSKYIEYTLNIYSIYIQKGDVQKIYMSSGGKSKPKY